MTALISNEIQTLKKEILLLGASVEENLRKAMQSLFNYDARLAQRVKETDKEIDQTEISVEEKCLRVLALHQPVASDLRFVVTVLKINSDLERIGDLAAKIAGKVILLAEGGAAVLDIPDEFHAMYEKTVWMLKASLDSLVNGDTALAYKILSADKEVNDSKRKIRALIEKKISEHTEQGINLVKLMGVSRSLERIGDHATNIAEDVIYLLEGKIIRHQ